MNTPLSPILSTPYQLVFRIGNRFYFVVYHFNGNVENMWINYGACVLKNNGMNNYTENDFEKHFQTATNRYYRFPVTTPFNSNLNQKWFPKYTTRSSILKTTTSKKFQKYLVKLFCQNGVRNRENGIKSIKQSEFQQRIATISKLKHRALAKKQTNISKFNKTHSEKKYRIQDDFSEQDIENLQNTKPYSTILIEKKRIIHIVYQHLSNGKTKYGACIYRPNTQQQLKTLQKIVESSDKHCLVNHDSLDTINYDQYGHLITAFHRMNQYGVKITLPSSMRYNTRSNYINDYDQKAYKFLRKAIGKYGVRSRTGVGIKQPNFINKHYINNTYSIQLKKLNREYNTTLKDFSVWKIRSKIQSNNH